MLSNVATAAHWIRQCRRAGLYELGRVLYEIGGLDFAAVSEEGHMAVEDYQVFVAGVMRLMDGTNDKVVKMSESKPRAFTDALSK